MGAPIATALAPAIAQGLRVSTGEGWVQCIAPKDCMSGDVAVALRGYDVPVILDTRGALVGVKSGNLHTYTSTAGEIVWRWRQ